MDYLELCESITEEIEDEINDLIGKKEASRQIRIGADDKPTRLIDNRAEKAAMNLLKSEDVLLITEESGKVDFGEPECAVILDPVDGTFNATKDIPFYSVSVAVADLDLSKIKFGYIKDIPRDNIYYANRDKSYLNGNEISVSQESELAKSSVSYYSYGVDKYKKSRLDQFVDRVRTLGCISLEMCYVASGKLEGFVDVRGAGVMDIAAASLIVRSAGGSFEVFSSNFPSKKVKKSTKSVASNGLVHEDIKGVL
ncbi:MAG: Archaeal fructose-1,6-bisphosphatase SuhB [Candidatus Methanohalarchaeum thermophilum]|uniref:fructose-bisphosphatase n=1 Tax=Methanohalarchaeum thermophilum TaxID=1903181 RepID=A0A1Q6DUY2_METT1|nr:MAG: Archaeal fructose-1,6-bisphosphatase SuhB [Candidatus Methanohalarchaeum thermophilum]